MKQALKTKQNYLHFIHTKVRQLGADVILGQVQSDGCVLFRSSAGGRKL